ncbi:hypothetical protein ACFL20_13665, partial [Spirochaetota bacterium]
MNKLLNLRLIFAGEFDENKIRSGLRMLMKRFNAKILFIFIIIVFICNISYAGTEITIPPTNINTDGITKVVDQYQEISDKNGVPIGNSYGMANLLGYPVGRAYLGSFPHFFIGV